MTPVHDWSAFRASADQQRQAWKDRRRQNLETFGELSGLRFKIEPGGMTVAVKLAHHRTWQLIWHIGKGFVRLPGKDNPWQRSKRINTSAELAALLEGMR